MTLTETQIALAFTRFATRSVGYSRYEQDLASFVPGKLVELGIAFVMLC